VGTDPGSTGTALITGTGSKWSSMSLGVGREGTGYFTVSNGGALYINGASYVGSTATGVGNLTVTGANSNWTTTGNTYIGNAGSGTVNIAAGGSVNQVDTYVGKDSGSIGNVTVNAASWTNTGFNYVGYGGNGTFLIEGGANISQAETWIGYSTGSNGSVMVTGSGTTCSPPISPTTNSAWASPRRSKRYQIY
jgi:T5SS/PEP-CTERM-associated repeat protein